MVNNCLNYKTSYYYILNNNEIEHVDWVCFSKLYRKMDNYGSLPNQNGKIGIKVYFDKKINEERYDNYCILSESELNQYILWLKKTTGFNVRISNTIKIDNNIESDKFQIITTKFKNKYPYEIKLICALIRNLYECPYNIMVKTAFLMENLDEFKHLDFTERLSIAINSLNGYNTNHSVFSYDGCDFYNNKSIRKRYLKASKTERNVNGFMLKTIIYDQNRYYYESMINEDTEETIFDSLEDNYISNEFKKILIKIYEIIKEKYGK